MCPRTVHNLCCILPNARGVHPGPRYHGHVDKLVAKVLGCHIIVLRLVGNSSNLVTIEPKPIAISPACLRPHSFST